MATRHGHEIAARLVRDHGWHWALCDPDVIGDRWVVDPLTGQRHSPYEAQKIQAARDSGQVPDEQNRESD